MIGPPATLFRTVFAAMGTEITVLTTGSAAEHHAAVRIASTRFTTNEALFSRFRADSELSLINSASAGQIPASPELLDLVSAAFDLSDRTGGLFDPTLLRELVAAGYDRNFDDLQPLPSTARRSAVPLRRRRCVARPVIDRESGTLLRRPGIELDLGGIAKGWTVDAAAAETPQDHPFLIDAGGDIYARGAGPDGTGWIIGVADPYDGDRDVATLRLHDKAVATSAVTKRRWPSQGKEQHHIIDPRSGEPVHNNIASVTVVGSNVAMAEALAKAALVAGVAAGAAMIEQFPDCDAFFVEKNGAQTWTDTMARYRVTS